MPADSNLVSAKAPTAINYRQLLFVSFRFVFIFRQVPRGKRAACNLNGLTRCSSVVSTRLGSTKKS